MFGITTQPDLYFKSTLGVAKNPNHDGLDHFRYAQDKKTQTGPIYSASLMLRNCTTEAEFLSKTRFLFVLYTFLGLTQLNAQRLVVRRFIVAGNYSQCPINQATTI